VPPTVENSQHFWGQCKKDFQPKFMNNRCA
jgi:hypothetical protein